MLAFNEYFWSDWLGSSPPAVVVTPATPGRGSGKNRGHGFLDDYIPMSEDEWEQRAKRIKADNPNPLFDEESFSKKFEAPRLVLDQAVANQLDAMTTERTSLMQNMANLPSVDALKQAVARLRQIDQEIPALKKRLYVYTPAKFT